MTRLTRVALVAGALCYLALAAAVFAFAGDVAAWRDAISMDDVRYRVAPGEEDLWQPAAVLPFGIAGDALSVGDDVRFRTLSGLAPGRLELGITSDRSSRCSGGSTNGLQEIAGGG
jgi:hypothetical protein